jgi:hypothetical protein
MIIFKSRKFWLAVFAVVQTVVSHYLQIPQDIWVSINALIVVVILGITVEDAAEKSARTYFVDEDSEDPE